MTLHFLKPFTVHSTLFFRFFFFFFFFCRFTFLSRRNVCGLSALQRKVRGRELLSSLLWWSSRRRADKVRELTKGIGAPILLSRFSLGPRALAQICFSDARLNRWEAAEAESESGIEWAELRGGTGGWSLARVEVGGACQRETGDDLLQREWKRNPAH